MKENKFVLICCASLAAFFVSIFDLTFNGINSLPMKIGEAIRIFIIKGWDSSALIGLILIIAFGGFICFIRDPKSKILAGEIGLGIISLITTLASPISQEAVSRSLASNAAVTREIAQVANKYESKNGIVLELEKHDESNPFLVQVRDAKTDVLLVTRTTNSDVIDLDSIDKKGEYVVYLEGKGHRWTKFKVTYDGTKTLLKVKPEDSNVPMLFQRFTGAKKPASLTSIPAEN
jgi:hypothetical protein